MRTREETMRRVMIGRRRRIGRISGGRMSGGSRKRARPSHHSTRVHGVIITLISGGG